ncbi:hypothetical protein HPP92_008847 [Vanilla planifolia]|uniref:Cytochrome P450 71A1 n=1 Tax=Vanilla planifolia TaxID=51239 RepID=A0A835R6U0_VANPL|nr:hypothetical protein HPP92_008847 [Vanilla planifolia]
MVSFLFLVAVIALGSWCLINRRNATNLPWSRTPLPVIGHLHLLGSLPHRSLASLAKKHGPLLLLRLGGVPTAVVSSAEVAEKVMKTHDLTFASRPALSMADRLVYGSCDVSFHGYGEYWRQTRRISIVHFLSAKRVQDFRQVREEEVALFLAEVRTAATAFSPVNLSKRLATLTNDITCRVALGRKYSGEKQFREMLKEFTTLLGTFSMADYVPCLGWVDELRGLNSRVRKNFKEFDGFIERVLQEHAKDRATDSGSCSEVKDCLDFVDALLSLRNRGDAVIDLTVRGWETIKALIMDVFAAGTDSVFTAIEWTMAELIKNPSSMRKAQEEVRRIVGSHSTASEEDIDKMEYLKAIIKESLRLHPPLPLLVPREAMRHTELQGCVIPKGTRVFVNAWAIARCPKDWDRAEEFWPERFLNCSVDFKGHDFKFVPFGAGRRGCPGVSFTTAILEYVLANLLHSFDWEVPEEEKAGVLDMSETDGITARKKYDLVLRAKPNLGILHAQSG